MSHACYAVLPAAGRSGRMQGPSKLLLPWDGGTVIDRVLQVWTESPATGVVVVVRKEDRALQKAIRRWPKVDLIVPDEDPPEMKKSVRIGLHFLQATRSPSAGDRWLIAPADLPSLSTEVIGRVIGASQSSDRIVAPRFGERKGHPVSLPWSLVPQIDALDSDQGIDHLIAERPVEWVDLPADWYPEDLDTPEQYRRQRGGSRRAAADSEEERETTGTPKDTKNQGAP